jgi:hypothetical protein
VKLRLSRGSALDLAFRSEGGLVDWDIHSHPPAGLTQHQWGQGLGARTRFRASIDGEYYCMFSLDARAEEPVTIHVELRVEGRGGIQFAPPAPSRTGGSA